MTTSYHDPDRSHAVRRHELRHKILHALGSMTGPVRPEQRELARALDATDSGFYRMAARIILEQVRP